LSNKENPILIEKLKELALKLENEKVLEYLKILESKYLSDYLFCTLLGETSSGKSTYLNSLIGKKIIPEMSISSTGTIVKAFFKNTSKGYLYKAIYKDRTEELSLTELQSLSLNSAEDLEYLEIISTSKLNIDENLCLIDTPGFNSSLKHKIILDNFLPQSDLILYFVNYRRGLNPNDKFYLEIIKETISDYKDSLIILVNYCGENANHKKLKEIKDKLNEIIDYDKDVYVVSEKIVENEIYLYQSNVESFFSEIANSNKRKEIVESNLKNQLLYCLVELISDLDENVKSFSFKKSNSSRLKNRIQELRSLEKQGLKIIERYNEKYKLYLNELIEQFDLEVKSDIAIKIDQESRIENINSSISYYKDHLAIHKINLLYDKIRSCFNKLSSELGEELEYLEIQIENNQQQDMDFKNESWLNTKKQLFRIIGNKVVSYPFSSYLVKIGGAAGEKAGIYNLGKKVLSKGSAVIGKKFKKQVYDNMGHLMKKMGINSSRAIAVWGIVVLEGIQKTYKVLTWKKKLLKSLEKGFSESIIKIEEENLEDIRKVKELNIELIKDNFNRRIGPLERIMINSEKGIQSIQDNINSCMNLVNEIENLLK